MTGIKQETILGLFQDEAPVPGFYTGMATPVGFDTEEIQFDIEREDGDVAVGIRTMTEGGRWNEVTLATNKRFAPGLYKENTPLSAERIGYTRVPGQNPYASVGFQYKAAAAALKAFRKQRNKIMRAVEINGAQVMQTGIATLVFADSTTQVNFNMRVAHKPTASIAWGTGTEDKVGDVASLCDTVKNNGKSRIRKACFGKTAWKRWISDANVLKLLDVRNYLPGQIVQAKQADDGSTYHGEMEIGNHVVQLYSYDQVYKDPTTGLDANYQDPNKVVIAAEAMQAITGWGSVNRFKGVDNELLQYVPDKVQDKNSIIYNHAYTTDDSTSLVLQTAARVLWIPQSIDRFGCLTTV